MRRLLALLLLTTTPAWAQQAPAKPDPAQLLAALRAAPNPQVAAALEARITEVWLNAGSPAVTLLMSRALHEMQAGEYKDAVEDFGAASDLSPELAEPWTQQALARYHLGDTEGALRDIAQALKREPRQFEALRLLSIVAENRGDWKGAYAAWEKLLQIDPMTPGGADRLKQLRLHAFGQAT